MGTGWSLPEREPSPDPWWGHTSSGTQSTVSEDGKQSQCIAERNEREKLRKEEMDAFKKELAVKREARQKAISTLQCELERLRNEIKQEKELRIKAEQERDQLIENKTGLPTEIVESEEIKRLVEELEQEKQQRKSAEEERDTLKERESQLEALEKQVRALKEVASIGREMLRIRELQVNELKSKLQEVEFIQQSAPEDLREEYEMQIDNIRKLRVLYEERALATRVEHQRDIDKEKAKIHMLEVKISDLQDEFNELQEKRQKYEEKIKELEENLEEKKNEIGNLQDKLHSSTAECKTLTSQMTVINNLFSQILVGPEMNLDRLTRLLQDNHGIITDLTAKGDINDIAALLLDIASKAEGENKNLSTSESLDLCNSKTAPLATQQEIASNLSQVWRVLVELLSHHKNTNTINIGGSESCYKSVDTPTGPRLVISVSKTFITLKDLILEKKSLVKEVGRLKTLNGHLENRLDVQERRLSVVSTELKKTWGLVSKLRQQHKQLHTQEKILRYELQHKRYMLTELKQELEHCREKWERARQKNTQSEEDWRQLRREFALRKSRQESNSAESGYEEDDSGQSPPSEINEPIDTSDKTLEVAHTNLEENEPEEDVEQSDGNSFDTVIDLLDISSLENEDVDQIYVDTATTNNAQSLPLNDDELSEGLSQIESAELAAELGLTTCQARTDFLASFPSSSLSSPIPTETDDVGSSSDLETSEDDLATNIVSAQYPIHYTASPVTVPQISQDSLLFGSNSAQNISRFLDGLNINDDLIIPEISENNNTENLLINEQSSTQILEENCDLNAEDISVQTNSIPIITVSPTIQENYAVQLCLHFEEEQVDDTTSSYLQNYVSVNNVQEDNPVFTEKKISSGVLLVDNSETVSVNHSQTNTSENRIQQAVTTIPSEESQEDIISRLKALAKKTEVTEIKTTVTPTNTLINGNSVDSTLEQSNNSSATERTETTLSRTDSLKKRTPEEILEARAARLKRMEEQCKSLFSKMSATSQRSDIISNKLVELHEQYGSKENAQETGESSSVASERSEENNEPAGTTASVSENQFKNIEQTSSAESSNDASQPPGISIRLPKSETERISENTTDISENGSQPPGISTRLSNSETERISENTTDISENGSQPPGISTRLSNSETERISQNTTDITNNGSQPPGVSNHQSNSEAERISPNATEKCDSRSTGDILDARALRLKRLEDQCKSLFTKMSATSQRSDVISNKLEQLHDQYGAPETAHCSTQENVLQVTSLVNVTNEQSTSSSDDVNNVCETSSESGAMGIDPGLSSENTNESIMKTTENLLDVRTGRLQHLEEQCKSLFRKVADTKYKSDTLSIKLEGLHEMYGDNGSTPPSTSEDVTSLGTSPDGTSNSSTSKQNDELNFK